MNSTILLGRQGSDSTPMVKKEHGKLVRGLLLANGAEVWFPNCYVSDFYDDLAVIDNGEFGVINRRGEYLFEPEFSFIDNFIEGRSFASRGGATLLLSNDGGIIKHWPESLLSVGFSNGIARVSKFRGSYHSLLSGYVDRGGKWVVRMIEERQIKDFRFLVDLNDNYSDGLIRFCKNGLFGFIDREFQMVIPCMYESISRFENGLAAVQTERGCGFISRENEFVIPPEYDRIRPFNKGIGYVEKDSIWQAITVTGEVIAETSAVYLEHEFQDYIQFSQGDGWGVMDPLFDVIFPPKEGIIVNWKDGLLSFTRNNHRGYADIHGNELIADRAFGEEIRGD